MAIDGEGGGLCGALRIVKKVLMTLTAVSDLV